MAALLGADTLSSEINSGTIQTIVTKPIRRSDVVFGKWLGFAGLLGLYLLLMAGGAIVSVCAQSGYTPPHLICRVGVDLPGKPAGDDDGAAVFQPLVCACDRRSHLRLVRHGFHRRMGGADRRGPPEPDGVKVGIVSSLIIPSESLWRRAAFEMQSPLSGVLGISPFGTTSVPSLLMIGYAGVYLLITLGLTVLVFRRRDL